MQGAGFVCYYVLDCLATQALKVNRPHLGRPEIKADEDIKPEIMENTSEIILEKVEEEQNALFNSDEDMNDDDDDEIDIGNRLNMKDNSKMRDLSASHGGKNENGSQLTGEMWKMEIERALPQLKIVVKPDLKDWRARWEQMKQCREQINSVYVVIVINCVLLKLIEFFALAIGRNTNTAEENPARCYVCNGQNRKPRKASE